jgi:hypothetical protein
MQKYNQLEVSYDSYEKIKATQAKNKTIYNEHIYGSRRSLYVNDVLIASCSVVSSLDIGQLKNSQFVSFLGMFNRHLYSRIIANQDLLNLKIEYKELSRDKNLIAWQSISQGTFFYNVDLSSAYWQIAYRLGYISTEVFKKYQYQDEYKQAKRYCISFLARSNTMQYSNRDSITCDISALQQVYDNIRNELYSCVNKCLTGVNDWLEYNIDGVSVLSKDVGTVKKCLTDMNLDFKINECVKVSDREYLYKGKTRLFTRNKVLSVTN